MMVRYNVCLRAIFAVFWSMFAGIALAEAPEPHAAEEQPGQGLEVRDNLLDLVPVIAIGPDDPKTVAFALRNETQGPIRYFVGPRHGLAWLNMDLTAEDGTDVPYCVMIDWAVNPKDLRVLEPGGAIPIRVDLNDFGLNKVLGNIPPGRYVLRAVSSGISQYGSTPLKIDRTIAIVDLQAGLAAGFAWPWLAALALVGAVAWAWRHRRHRFRPSSPPL